MNNNIKKEALEHITEYKKVSIGYNTDFQNENSQITNEYHKGQNYSVKQDEEKLLVTNKENGQKYTVDLDMLTKEFNPIERIKLKKFSKNYLAKFWLILQ